MPTGYTSDIAKGISFEQFALDCARNFGATIMMRDDPKGTPIPEEFQPSPHYKKSLDSASKHLASLKTRTPSQWRKAHQAFVSETVKRCGQRIRDKNDLEGKYRAMLAQVKDWAPPTHEHEGLGKFMISQIEESISSDCGGDYYEREIVNAAVQTLKEFKQEIIQEAKRRVEYSTKSWNEEVQRTNDRNAWIKNLRLSLTPTPNQ